MKLYNGMVLFELENNNYYSIYDMSDGMISYWDKFGNECTVDGFVFRIFISEGKIKHSIKHERLYKLKVLNNEIR